MAVRALQSLAERGEVDRSAPLEAARRYRLSDVTAGASGNEGGWQVARCLQFLCVLTGAVGAEGGTLLNTQSKFVPPPVVGALALKYR